jgi:hypothetical protein
MEQAAYMTGLPVLLHRHFSPFRMYVDRATRTVVVLNPKVASRNVRFILSSALMEARELSDPSEGRYGLFKKAREFPFAPVRDYLDVLRHPDRYAFYCFVRNPYARLKSAWVDKIAIGETEGFRRSARGYLPALRRFARQRGLPGGTNDFIPFGTFVAFVEWQKDGRRDKHWDLQTSVLLADVLKYTETFRIETEFAEGMRLVLRRLNVLNCRSEMLIDVRRGIGPKHDRAVYDAILAQRAFGIFAHDFQAFGYHADSWQGL